MMSNRKNVLKDVGTYAGSAYISQIFDFVNGILVRKFLGPSTMGLWSLLQVVISYSKYSLLGTVQAAAKEIPYKIGKGEELEAAEIKNNVYGFAIFSGIINAFFCLIFAVWHNKTLDQDFIVGIGAAGFIILGQRLYNYWVVLLRVTKQFNVASALMLFSSVVSLLLTVSLILPFGFYGFLISQTVIYVINLAFIRRFGKLSLTYSLNFKVIRPVIRLGLSLILCQVSYVVFTSLDRIFISRMLGFTPLGLFSVAIMANTYILSFPNIAGIVLFPYYQEKFGKRDNPKDLESYVMYPTITLTYILPFLICLVWFFSPLLFHYFLPQYVDGLPALKLLIIGSYFLCLTQHFNVFLITIQKQFQLFLATLLATAVLSAVLYGTIRTGWGITGVAAGESAVFALYLFFLMFLSLRSLKAGWRQLFWCFMQAVLVITYTIAGISLIERWTLSQPLPLIILTLLRLFVSLIYLSPLMLIAEKRTQVASHCWSIVREKLGRKRK